MPSARRLAGGGGRLSLEPFLTGLLLPNSLLLVYVQATILDLPSDCRLNLILELQKSLQAGTERAKLLGINLLGQCCRQSLLFLIFLSGGAIIATPTLSVKVGRLTA